VPIRIPYEELEGSPTITMDRKGGSAERKLRIAWSNIGAAILEVFPGAIFGYPYNAQMPGFPWLRAQSMRIEPWDPKNPRPDSFGLGTNSYPGGGALLTINYAPNEFDDNQTSTDKKNPENVVFLEQSIAVSGEFLTWPNQGVRWETGTEGSAFIAGNNDKRWVVNEDIKVGIVIPMLDHTLTWNYVKSPPWDAIRNCIGKVNQDAFNGCAPETLLFLGATASRSFSTIGFPWWKLGYKFAEKCMNAPLKPKDVPQGWNHFLRPNGANTKFERLVKANGDPVYALTRFRQLFGGKA